MSRSLSRLAFGVLVGGLLLTGGQVLAQGPMGTSGTGAGANPITNPYMSPYANPYLNPALTVNSTNRNDALLYLWSAQQQPGGLLAPGGPGNVRSGSTGSRVAEMPKTAMVPGGGASKYFSRGTTAAQVGSAPSSRYGRQGRFFAHNGR